MASITRTLSSRTKSNGNAQILLRVNVSHSKQIRIKSGVFIPPRFMNGGTLSLPPAGDASWTQIQSSLTRLALIEAALIDFCENHNPAEISGDKLRMIAAECSNRTIHDDKKPVANDTFFAAFERFLAKGNLSAVRIRNYRVLMRSLQRYERFIGLTSGHAFRLTSDGFTTAHVKEFEQFLKDEPLIAARHPTLYERGAPSPRGNNTISSRLRNLRTFFNWCNRTGITDNRPFSTYGNTIREVYGTPYFITVEERNLIAGFNLGYDKKLETQRDIFVFQCLTGCRVSDLMKLTPINIINGNLEYIAGKTSRSRPGVTQVPLHPAAEKLIEKYRGHDSRGRLFPYLAAQSYNYSIKKVFTACGINRPVTILNPRTGLEEKRPINTVASSHLARRTFIGNLYGRLPDPNIIGSMSGHCEGSQAFFRYRTVDTALKREAIGLL